MTQSGEELTLKGESKPVLESIFSYNKAMAVRYTVDIEDRSKVQISMSYPDKNIFDTYQMIFVMKGEMHISKNGEVLTEQKISAQQHNLCRFPFTTTRMAMDIKDDIISINLSHDFLCRYLPASHLVQHTFRKRDAEDGPVMLSEMNMLLTPEINAILQRLSVSSEGGLCDQLLLESKVIELLALQVAQFEQLQSNTARAQLKKGEEERMQQAREILIHHTGEPLSLRALAHLVGTNEFNLKRDFKVVFGNTVFGYLNQHKMEQAKAMLIEKHISIAEISLKMGYKHATHFTNAFKKYFGYLPNKIKAGKLSLLIFWEEFLAIVEKLEFLMV